VPWQIIQEVELPKDIIAQRIDFMRTHMPDGEIVETQAKGFIIHRDLFDQHLAQLATKAGAELFLGTRAIGYEGGIVYTKGKQELKIKPGVIIGADGPHSIVSKWIGSQNREFINAFQYQMPLVEELSSTCIYFREDIFGGYGWVFPKGKIANVGIGIRKGKAKGVLDSFVSALENKGVVENRILKQTQGLIPMSGMIKLRKGNMALVGDAAGLTHPITGAGIMNAVISGKLAGLSELDKYEEECSDIFEGVLMKAYYKRKLLEKNWGNLRNVLKKIWIAFSDYYK